MISEIRIQNFKSIQDLTLKLGRVTVLIGENGSGKSNILEAIAFASGAATNKLDNEYLANRGIRVAEDAWMRSAFPIEKSDSDKYKEQIQLLIHSGPDTTFEYIVEALERADDGSFGGWFVTAPIGEEEILEKLRQESVAKAIKKGLKNFKASSFTKEEQKIPRLVEQVTKVYTETYTKVYLAVNKAQSMHKSASALGLIDFMIYAPENTTLRNPPPESAIQPMGVKGEGLFKLLQSFADPKFENHLKDLKENLRLFGWFEDFLVPDPTATASARLQIRDRWLAPERAVIDQRSANEGFLFLLFYFALLISWRTPRFFAIDNIDNALNPKLCSKLMQRLVELAQKYDKQIICTTHNPAILDGLNLKDDDQRLYVVERDSEGPTRLRRIRAPQPQPGEAPVRLSEAFIEGLIGGLPKNF